MSNSKIPQSSQRVKQDKFIPPGYVTRFEALQDIIRFGPGTLPRSSTFKQFLFLAERTLLWNKESDTCSYNQQVRGMIKKNGDVVTGGSGNSLATAKRENRWLEKQGLIKRIRHSSARRGYESTEYSMCWAAWNRYRIKMLERLIKEHSMIRNMPKTSQSQGFQRPLGSNRAIPLAQTEPYIINNTLIKNRGKKEAARSHAVEWMKENLTAKPAADRTPILAHVVYVAWMQNFCDVTETPPRLGSLLRVMRCESAGLLDTGQFGKLLRTHVSRKIESHGGAKRPTVYFGLAFRNQESQQQAIAATERDRQRQLERIVRRRA